MKKKRSRQTKKSAAVVKKKGTPAAPLIDPAQLTLPAGFSADHRRLVPLRDVLDPAIPTTGSLAELSPEERARLVARRIQAQPGFKISMLGVGTIDKARAIKEVTAQTKVGQVLVEIEQHLIDSLVKRARSRPGH